MKRQNNKEQRGSDIPENNPSKAMDSKREVEQSPDEKTDQDFPGYPHYPAKEDIMDQRTDSHRVDMDVEELPNSPNRTVLVSALQAIIHRSIEIVVPALNRAPIMTSLILIQERK